MKIAVNLLPFRKKIAGAGKYAKEITRALSKLDSENDYYLYGSEEIRNDFKELGNNFHFIVTNFNPNLPFVRILWEQIVFPFKLRKLNPDIVFTPSVAIPFLYNGKFFTTIHDLAYKENIHKYPFLRKMYLKKITEIAVKKSSVVFTVSNFSKKEIEKEFITKNKIISVTYNGVDEIYFSDYTSEEIKNFVKRYNLPEKFILYVGAIEPSKNLDKLLLAFSDFLHKYDLPYKLVLTAGIGWNQKFLMELINDLEIKTEVIFLPFIPETELPLLYKSSAMFIYLSSYEGFGIPVLEAMAIGTPVITSQSKAILEFAKPFVISVDPNRISEIVEGMHRVIFDTDSINKFINKGKDLAKNFKWTNSARVILNHFNTIKDNKN